MSSAGPGAMSALFPLPTKARQGFEKRQFRSTTAFQSVEPALCLNHLEIPSNHTDVARSETSVGQPQAGAAAHACTDYEARNAFAKHAGPCVTPCPAAISKHGSRHPHDSRRAAKPQGETGGRGGNYFPRIALTFPAARVPQSPVSPGHAVRTRGLHAARCVSLLPFRLFLTFD